MLPLRDNISHRRVPWVNYGIIGACVGMYLYQVADPSLVERLAFRPSFVLPQDGVHLPVAQLLLAATATMFMHGGLAHLLGNMWFLWIFGDNVEDRMGPMRFLVFYVICGFAATAAHTGIALLSTGLTGPGELAIPMVGASGAIAGVLAAYLRMFPKARVLTLIPFVFLMVVEIPAVAFIVFWFILQLLYGLSSLGGGSGVAFWAHVGGFAAGYAMLRLFVPLPRRRPRPPRVLDMRWE